MRISDWSSDVCSSDLRPHAVCPLRKALLIDHNVATQEGPLGPSSFSSRNPTPPTMPRNIAAAGPLRDLLDTQSTAMPPPSAEQPVCEIGRASGRDRVCQYVYIPVLAGSLKKKK